MPSTSVSLVTNGSGASMPSTRSYALRIQWKRAVSAVSLRSVQSLPGGKERVAAGRQVVLVALERERQAALDDEQHALGAGVGLGPVAAAAGRHLDDVLREGLREPGQRARDHPQPGAVPERQVAGDDVAHGAARQHRVRLGEDRAVGGQLRSAVGGRPSARNTVARYWSCCTSTQEPAPRLVVDVNLLAPQPGAAHLTREGTSVIRRDGVLVVQAVHVDHERVVGRENAEVGVVPDVDAPLADADRSAWPAPGTSSGTRRPGRSHADAPGSTPRPGRAAARRCRPRPRRSRRCPDTSGRAWTASGRRRRDR